MELKKREFLAGVLGAGAGLASGRRHGAQARIMRPGGGARAKINSGRQTSTVDMDYKPRRFNKVIELWEDGQPAWYTTVRPEPARDSYALGKAMCKTWADMINYDMEHELFDLAELHEFMRGLADGGGTRSGHRMPVVFVTCPGAGPERRLYAGQQLGAGADTGYGVTGVQICHARDPKAVEVAAHMACRYPFEYPDVRKLARQGLRGASANFANQVWGMNNAQYVRIADLWPLNPKGEIIFGLKIEDTFADANAKRRCRFPASHSPNGVRPTTITGSAISTACRWTAAASTKPKFPRIDGSAQHGAAAVQEAQCPLPEPGHQYAREPSITSSARSGMAPCCWSGRKRPLLTGREYSKRKNADLTGTI